jgi:hypothetical protein
MTPQELQSVVLKVCPNAKVNMADSSYACPKIDWVTNTFYRKMFYPWIRENELNKWEKTHDCDNFAYLFFTLAQICHTKSMRTLKEHNVPIHPGLSVGVIYYKREVSGGGHAANVIVSGSEVYFVEPQTGHKFELTNNEKGSAWNMVF